MASMRYPNLELIEFMTSQAISVRYKNRIEEIIKQKSRFIMDFTAEVFPQLWGSTNTAFDIMPDGSPAIGGAAMTEAYTVIMHERTLNVYVIFVDNRICYSVENANKAFIDDMKNHHIASLSQALKRYNEDTKR